MEGSECVPFAVLIVTTRKFPYCLGLTCVVWATVGDLGSSLTQMKSPTLTLWVDTHRFKSLYKVLKYLVDQRCKRCLVRAWQRCHRQIHV